MTIICAWYDSHKGYLLSDRLIETEEPETTRTLHNKYWQTKSHIFGISGDFSDLIKLRYDCPDYQDVPTFLLHRQMENVEVIAVPKGSRHISKISLDYPVWQDVPPAFCSSLIHFAAIGYLSDVAVGIASVWSTLTDSSSLDYDTSLSSTLVKHLRMFMPPCPNLWCCHQFTLSS